MKGQTAKPRKPDGQLRFGMMWMNSPTPNITSKAMADRNPDVLDADTHAELARIAENTGVDFVFFADGYTHHGPGNARVGHGEPCVSAPIYAPIVMAATRHVGVVTTVHTRYLPPAVIARLGANLDVLSGGRWGWNVVPGSKGSEADLLGIDLVEHDARYAMAAEAVEAVKALWAARGEPVTFEGEHYRFRGTPRGPYPVQEPWPLLFNAGVSPAGQEFISQSCDYAFFAVVDDLAKVREPVERLSALTESKGRSPLEVNMAGSIGVVLGDTHRDAQDKYAWIRDSIDMEAARGWAKGFLGGSQTYQSTYGGGDFDEAARKIGMAAGSSVLVGTPEEVAEQFLHIHRETGLRGFMILNLMWAPDEVARLGAVFPHLKKAGVWTPPAERGWSW
ncbi:LLM class flavin-dependent oxidoreductase [Nonomuraea sp. NPDC050394]|uniref:LLM class flavin-dependent oxidoreductase n=1 Tax=Nonomuraea sp. NPDC050394 TaxID=3364363 RepID=UPI0037B02704